MRRTGRQP